MVSAKRTITVIIGLLLFYAVLESLYRVYKYREREAYYREDVGFTTTSGPLYRLEKKTGYSYVPNSRLVQRFYNGSNEVTGQNRISVNNLGAISPRDDIVEGSDSEFRIVCLGNSFTAITPTELPWPAQLEERLNEDEELKEATGKSVFKVLNLGLDGTGIDHWPTVYEHKGKEFDPQLVIVNFIWHDILRKFLYRDTVGLRSDIADYSVMVICNSLPAVFDNPDCLYGSAIVVDQAVADDKSNLARIRREIHDRKMASLPWFSVYPEFLSSLLGRSSSFDRRNSPTPLFADREKALSRSLEALQEISAEHPDVLNFFHPTVEECLEGEALPLALDLMERGSDLRIQNMLDFLPMNSSEDEIKRWYNLPYDGHPSSYGCELYSRAMHDRIREHLGAREIDQ